MEDLSPDVEKKFPFNLIRYVVRLLRKLKLKLFLRRKLKYGANVNFGPNSKLMIPTSCHIGSNFSCGRNFFVQTNLKVGDGCLISSDVSVVGHDHHVNEAGYSNYWSGRRAPCKVIFCGDNFVGYRATILGNVKIGHGAIVAAGALVNKDVGENEIVAGIPARVIGKRKL